MSKTSNSTSPEASACGSDGRWYQRIGPGVITACVVIGPGSILTSSKVGSAHGYSMSWIVLVSVAFMLVYMTLGAKLGVAADASPCELITRKAGKWLAVLIGGSVFFISAAFQFGNNLGVDSAFRVMLADPSAGGPSPAGFDPLNYTIVLFNALAIGFLFVFKNLYRAIERLMMLFVGLMLVSFAINLAFARPNVLEMASGFVPNNSATLDLSMLGLVGTTFVISAAFYQAYLVRQKGWGTDQLRSGLIDTRVGSAIMAAITLMIMSTAAAVLRGHDLGSVADVASQLEPAFGPWGKSLFCVGLFSAAYSSFLVNSMIGGFILSDALGLGSKPTDLWPKLLTSAVLLVGMCVAMFVIIRGWDKLPVIIAAQAVTVVAAPLVAGTLLWLCNCRDVMGSLRNKPALNVLAGIGLAMLLALAAYTAIVVIPKKVDDYYAQLPVHVASGRMAGLVTRGKFGIWDFSPWTRSLQLRRSFTTEPRVALAHPGSRVAKNLSDPNGVVQTHRFPCKTPLGFLLRCLTSFTQGGAAVPLTLGYDVQPLRGIRFAACISV